MNKLSARPNTQTAEPILQVDRLDIRISGRRILDSVRLRLYSGELVALLGPNGAGKSTLVRALAGEIHTPAECIRFAGKALSHWRRSEIAQHRAVMPQKVDLQFPMTVEEVVALGRPREKPQQRAQVVGTLLERLDIVHLKSRLVPTLSGGEQQRVQLARVLAQIWDQPDPHLLLLDECTSALDPAHQQLVFSQLRYRASAGYGLLVAVHDLNLAAQYADRLVLMKDGRIVSEGAPSTVLTPENLKAVYGLSARVTMLPEGYPLVIPTPHVPQAPAG
ncbi:heme ABC transporter ATP-binding protein [Marinobacter fonticola]|uniref:heme ABC transporter ATP-binding protein n=1 Tax=Marinobacter fonticola TaxID=2603215 RepID=UPI0011E677E9|nr:heme ABC transporter ATP-binding protein [Marinobacter fonticola]